jgi:SpoIIAA-like
MIELMQGLPGGTVGVDASGRITDEDYERVLVPALEQALECYERVRFLYHLGREFEGFTPAAIWDDVKVGMRHLTRFEKCAVVTDVGWIADAVRVLRVLMPCPVRIFGDARLAEAKAWLAA